MLNIPQSRFAEAQPAMDWALKALAAAAQNPVQNPKDPWQQFAFFFILPSAPMKRAQA